MPTYKEFKDKLKSMPVSIVPLESQFRCILYTGIIQLYKRGIKMGESMGFNTTMKYFGDSYKNEKFYYFFAHTDTPTLVYICKVVHRYLQITRFRNQKKYGEINLH